MSNGPYHQRECRCGAVSLLACGSPLAFGHDEGDRLVSLWPQSAVQLGQGVAELEACEPKTGGTVQSCRGCGEALLVEHEAAGVVALPGALSVGEALPVPPVGEIRARLVALGYRLVEHGAARRDGDESCGPANDGTSPS